MHDAALFAYIYSRVHNWHDAEDVQQEVLIKAWQANIDAPWWLHRVAHNATVDFHRSAARRHEETLDTLPDIPVDEIRAWEQREELHDILSKINPLYREVVLLRAEGYTFRAIAEKKGITLDVAYFRYKSAKRAAACYPERKKLLRYGD